MPTDRARVELGGPDRIRLYDHDEIWLDYVLSPHIQSFPRKRKPNFDLCDDGLLQSDDTRYFCLHSQAICQIIILMCKFGVLVLRLVSGENILKTLDG